MSETNSDILVGSLKLHAMPLSVSNLRPLYDSLPSNDAKRWQMREHLSGNIVKIANSSVRDWSAVQCPRFHIRHDEVDDPRSSKG